jgi:hypothetical protein
LLLGLLVFRELRGLHTGTYAEVIGGSVLMALGALAISSSSASEGEYGNWRQAAQREIELYGINPEYVSERMQGHEVSEAQVGRTWIDGVVIAIAILIFVVLGVMTRVPKMDIEAGWLAGFAVLLVGVLIVGAVVLRRVTKFT